MKTLILRDSVLFNAKRLGANLDSNIFYRWFWSSSYMFITSFLFLLKCRTVWVSLGSPQTVPETWIWIQFMWKIITESRVRKIGQWHSKGRKGNVRGISSFPGGQLKHNCYGNCAGDYSQSNPSKERKAEVFIHSCPPLVEEGSHACLHEGWVSLRL